MDEGMTRANSNEPKRFSKADAIRLADILIRRLPVARLEVPYALGPTATGHGQLAVGGQAWLI